MSTNDTILTIAGAVERPCSLTLADFAAFAAEDQIADVRTLGAKREGIAVRLAALLRRVEPRADAAWLGLHAAADDFHASIPLDAVRERAVVVYSLQQGPLPVAAGGPVRFFIPDHLACHASEIDECANVKFVDRIELTSTKGFDNRPHDDAAHEALHRGE